MQPVLIGILFAGCIPSGLEDSSQQFDGRRAHRSTRNLPFDVPGELMVAACCCDWQGPILCQEQAGDPGNGNGMPASRPGQSHPGDACRREGSDGTGFQFNSGPDYPVARNPLALVDDSSERLIFLNGAIKHRIVTPEPGAFYSGLHEDENRRVHRSGRLRSIRFIRSARYTTGVRSVPRLSGDPQTVLGYDLSGNPGGQSVPGPLTGGRTALLNGAAWVAGQPGDSKVTEKKPHEAPIKRPVSAPLKVRSGPTGAAGIQKLSSHLESVRAAHGLPAMAAAVIVNGRPVLTAAVGERKLGSGVRVTAEDKFHLGSCTKALTAFLIQRLVEEGHLQRDARVADLCPRLGLRLHDELTDLTLDHCLAHRGGFVPSEMTFDAIPQNSLKLHGARARFDYARRMVARKPRHPPGARYEYSNVGHTIAAVIAEEKMRRPWEMLMKKYIYDPLEMTTVGYGAAGSDGRIDQPWPHQPDGDRQKPLRPGPGTDNAELIGPAARIHCSLGDWARFAAEILRTRKPPPATRPGLLSAPASKRLLTPVLGNPTYGYAGGWVLGRDALHGPVLSHDGTNTLNFAHAWLLPEQKFGVLVATNSGIASAKQACRDLRTRVEADWLHGGISHDELKDEYTRMIHVRRWVSKLQLNQIDKSRSALSPELFNFLSSDAGQALCIKLRDQGPQKQLEFVTRQTRDGRKFSVYRLTFHKSIWRLEFSLDDRRHVTWLRAESPFREAP